MTTPEFTGAAQGEVFAVDSFAATAEETHAPPGIGPYALAWRRLKRDKIALGFGGMAMLMVLLCLLAPVYAHHIAHTGPYAQHEADYVKVGHKLEGVLDAHGLPIGPTWHSKFLLGADSNGRDVAVRLLYGGRNSLQIGAFATLLTFILAIILGVTAGYRRGPTDAVISRGLDLLWAYPVILLAVALGTAINVGGLNLGFTKVEGSSLWVPSIIIGVVIVPYVAKPLRGQVLTLREKEFVDAARAQGQGSLRIMISEILPNCASTIIVMVPLVLANAILTEAGLSYLGAGVQDPQPSWGTLIADGIHQFPGAFHLVLAPGIMLLLTVLGVNVFGDAVRDALDPRAKVRIER